MKLTYDLKCKYVKRANEEFQQMTGFTSSPFFAGAKATDEIQSDVKLWYENTQNEHINIDNHSSVLCSRYEIHCLNDENWPVYWSGSFHVNSTSFWSTNAYVKKEIWNKLCEIAKNSEVVPAVKDWNELSRIRKARLDKSANSREKIEIAEMDIDGSLTEQQIKDQYSNYYVVFMRTKISFHEIIGRYFDDTTMWRKEPEWSINIRPANKNMQDYYDHKCLYNKKKFEELMSKWSKYNAFNEET